MKISALLHHIDMGSMALPEFQRGYVWNRNQVRDLMMSLYRRYPVGSLLVWVTGTEDASTRGDQPLPPGTVRLLLDGQQRITSLYGIINGKPPKFFEGDAQAFTGLYFNLTDETFAFYSPLSMKEDPRWIDVTALMQRGLSGALKHVNQITDNSDEQETYFERLNRLFGIADVDLHVEEVTGTDKSLDVVVDIFNRVNSGGTKLSKGDLALAKICADWPEARGEMQKLLKKWRRAGFHFRLELLLRCINTIVTGEALFSALEPVTTDQFKDGLKMAERRIDHLLNLIASRLSLDHDRVFASRYALPLMARYLDQKGGKFDSPAEADRILYWYVHTFLWGRYSGSTESILNQDLALIDNTDQGLDRLIERLAQQRGGDLRVHPTDFAGWSRGARFYPLIYMLTRTWQARDWDSGLTLSRHLLGAMSQLELHHIFPRARLYKHGYDRADANALANFTFLTKETNLRVTDSDPAQYLQEIADRDVELLRSHWIPLDPALWQVDRYHDFLAARRDLLAEAANNFLDSLVAGTVPQPEKTEPITEREAPPTVGGIGAEDEEALLIELSQWVLDKGLPEGELLFELTNTQSGDPVAVLDLAWPEGLQEGLSQPVAILIEEPTAVIEAATQAGFRVFSEPESFRQYVRHEVLALDTEPAE